MLIKKNQHNQLLKVKTTPDENPIILEEIDPFLEWIVESRPTKVAYDDLSWKDLEPLPPQVVVSTSVGHRGSSQGTHDIDEKDNEDLDTRDNLQDILIIRYLSWHDVFVV